MAARAGTPGEARRGALTGLAPSAASPYVDEVKIRNHPPVEQR
jgi:hypothetical protein